MANEVGYIEPNATFNQHVVRNSATFSPVGANDLRVAAFVTAWQIDVTGVLDTEARQSEKIDLGAVRASEYYVEGAIEFALTGLTAGDTVDAYWAPSRAEPDGTANPGGVSGTDSDYTGDADSTLVQSLVQLIHIGSFVCTVLDEATGVQVGYFGTFAPPHRYGSLIIVNNSGATMATDVVETHFTLTPQIPQMQV
jgi:hypothetical protein